MSGTDDLGGIFDAIDPTPAETPAAETKTEEPASTPEPQETKTETPQVEEKTNTEEVETPAVQTPEQGQPEPTAEETTTEEPSKEKQPEVDDWKKNLPPPPPEYQGKKPEYDEDGNITNMNAAEYHEFVIDSAAARMRQEGYQATVENYAFVAAEQILPEMKTNPSVRQLVENARIASVLSGSPIDTVEAAQQVKQSLGIGADQIQQAKAEGAQNAKKSIQIQKNASLETSSTQTQEDTSTADQLTNRIRRGDSDAFVELLDLWNEEGKI